MVHHLWLFEMFSFSSRQLQTSSPKSSSPCAAAAKKPEQNIAYPKKSIEEKTGDIILLRYTILVLPRLLQCA